MLRARILEGIDALRQRKCRPDRETIAHYVLRKYGTQFNEIFNELEVIVDEELLIKVEYKGSVSYRLPSSFDTKASPLLTKHSKILNSVKTTRFIIAAVNEILSANESYTVAGIPVTELKSELEKLDPERFKDDKSVIAINRELLSKNANLIQSSRGRLYPKDIPIPNDDREDLEEIVDDGDAKIKTVVVPERKRGTAKPNKKSQGQLGTGTGSRSKNKDKTTKHKQKVEDGDGVPIVFAVKSKPVVLDPDTVEPIRKTYEGRFFTLVGGTSKEPSAAIAISSGIKKETETESEDPINSYIDPLDITTINPQDIKAIGVGSTICDLTQYLGIRDKGESSDLFSNPLQTTSTESDFDQANPPAKRARKKKNDLISSQNFTKADDVVTALITSTRKRTKR